MDFSRLYYLEQKNFDAIAENLAYLTNKFGIDIDDILIILKEKDKLISVPLDIFQTKLSPLESICKYLKDNLAYNFSQIAKLLSRDDRTIWITYENSKKKKVLFKISKTSYIIPIVILSNRKFSILENLTLYCTQELNLTIKELARLLNKKPSSLWTVYNRALKKGGESK